ncbi:hypothetical protein JRO89_XS12G0059600 [Xanthoceras sorbifolium]|uniref:Uncharacterized protein n=1 Tax=Xanthoceras sorbifolium TaxID=99658 RepID=A0ABQ8HBD9_9ROSI|nr:hypothetical protein JRO89_XS12G0059600 [Xanthoceras sorbifolium]
MLWLSTMSQIGQGRALSCQLLAPFWPMLTWEDIGKLLASQAFMSFSGERGGLSLVSSFGADHSKTLMEAEKKKKSSFFSCFYLSINIGALAAASCLVWLQTISLIRQQTPSDSIKGSINAWRLCTVTQVEELKSIIRLLPIWTSGIVFSAVYSQMGTLFVLQGNTMGTSFEIPIYDHLTDVSILTFIGQLELYEQDPDAMRSLCSALSLTAAAALGNSDLLN